MAVKSTLEPVAGEARAPAFQPWRNPGLWAAATLGALLRLYGLAAQSIWYDEGFTLAFSKKLGISLAFADPNVTSDAPLLPFLARAVAELFERIPLAAPGSYAYDAALHLVSALLSVAAILLCYRVVLALTEEKATATLTALLCAVSPFQVYYAQELKPYALMLALMLAAFLCLHVALERNRPAAWLGLALCFGLAMYAHLFNAWHIALFNLYFGIWCLLDLRRRYGAIPAWALTQIVAGLIAIPMVVLAFTWQAIYENIGFQWAERPTFKTPFITFKAFFAGFGASSWAYWPLFALCGTLFVLGLYRLRRNRNALLAVAVFALFSIGANVLIWRYRKFPFYEHRTFIFAAMFVYMTVASGFLAVPKRAARIAIAAVFVVLTGVCLRDYYAQNLHPMQSHRMGVRYKVDNRDAAAWIRHQWRPGDLVAHGSHFTYFPALHYLPGVTQCNLRTTQAELDGFLSALPNYAIWNNYGVIPVMADEATRSARRVWYVESWWEPDEIPPQVVGIRNWMSAHFAAKERAAFDGITVTLFEKK